MAMGTHIPSLHLKIDDREVVVPSGTLVIEAAKSAGIEIPFFCYHPKLSIAAQCRMCLVEVEKFPKLQPACALPTSEGMVVRTQTSEVLKTREGVLEILLSSHPLDCPICDKGGECPLQNLTYLHGPGKGKFQETKKDFEKPIVLGSRILLDRERCILCTRCVRFCDEIYGHRELGLIHMKGAKSEVGIFPGQPFESQFSGNTVEICPVGALTSRPFRFKARPWELKHTPSVCALCGLGCNVTLDTRDERVVRVYSPENRSVDDGWLCNRGRYETVESVHHPDRLTVPLMRVNGSFGSAREGGLDPVSWETALQAAAARLTDLKKSGNGAAVSGIVSPRVANETLYLFRKFMGEVLGSPPPERETGGGGREWARFVDQVVTHGTHPFSISDLDRADSLLILGADPSRDTPVIDLRIKKAARRGIDLPIYHTEEIELRHWATGGGVIQPGQALEILRMFGETLNPSAATEWSRVTPEVQRVVILLGPHGFEGHSTEEMIAALYGGIRPLTREGCDCRVGFLFPEANTMGAIHLGIGTFPSTGSDPSGGYPHGHLLVGADPFNGMEGSRSEEGPAVRPVSSRFVLVLETHRTRTVEQADLVLPLASPAEEDGTMTNTEGRVQRLRRAIPPPGQARPGWWILTRLAREMGYFRGFEYESFQEALEEISREVPGYEEVSVKTLGPEGLRVSQGVPVA
ncbi:MAG: NADH-quinone oxidoreductase subunit NuoG [Nitrospirae bacterium]|nr:NADH-quinone oxidoreductase subunit NuoG [Nitrospirota bacterium]